MRSSVYIARLGAKWLGLNVREGDGDKAPLSWLERCGIRGDGEGIGQADWRPNKMDENALVIEQVGSEAKLRIVVMLIIWIRMIELQQQPMMINNPDALDQRHCTQLFKLLLL